MTKDPVMRERRRSMAIQRLMGVKARKVYKKLSEEYDVSEKALQNDWSKRGEWLPEVFDFANAKSFANQLLAEQQFIKQRLWKHYDETQSYELKRRILSDIRSLSSELLEMMQELGRIHKEPDKLDVDVSTVSDETGEVIDAVLSEFSSENGHPAGEIEEGAAEETAGQISDGQGRG